MNMPIDDNTPEDEDIPDDELEAGGMSVEGHVPGARGSRALNRHLTRLAIRMVEMEQGLRPVSTLDRVASPLAGRRIRQQLFVVRNARHRGACRTAPVSAVRTVSFHPSAGVAEGVVVIRCDGRTRAFCIRLEEECGRWRIVDLASPETHLAAAITTASRTGAVPVGPDGVRRSSGRVEDDEDDPAIEDAVIEDGTAAEDRGPEDDGPRARRPDVS